MAKTEKNVLSPATLATEVSDRVQIDQVFLVETFARRNDIIEGFDGKIRQGRSVHAELDHDQVRLRVSARFSLSAYREGATDEDGFTKIEARFIAVYVLDSVEGLTKDHLQAFAETNGVFNLWPFWREFVQSTTVRMGLPPLTVPVYRVASQRVRDVAAMTKVEELPEGSAGAP